jgi:creatinine amidohydrolase
MEAGIFHFDDLTWPEVAALPRSTPLVLPLGHSDTLPEISTPFGGSRPIGLLPAIPFGWQGSGVETPQPVFFALVRNLLANLLEDGFMNLFVLAPQGVESPPDLPGRVLSSAPYRSEPLPAEGKQDKVVLLPVGHTEQHGYHAPLSTDTCIIQAIAEGTHAALPRRTECLATFPYGVSMHRRSFAGTFSVGGRAFEDFWLAVLDSLVGRGFTRFYLMSGHGGNSSFLTNVVKYAGERYPHTFCATSFLYLSGPQGVAALEKRRQSAPGGMGHACELETSLMLTLRPELIHLDRAVDETDFIRTPSYSMDWIEGGALVANPPWEDDTLTGAYGAPSLATASKGAYWLKAAIAEKVGHIAEIEEQYARRKAHREGGNPLQARHTRPKTGGRRPQSG